MDLRGRLTRIVVKEEEIWVVVAYPKRWIGDLRSVKFSVPFVVVGIPEVFVTIFGDPEIETPVGELARDVADDIYDEVIETLKANLSDQGNAIIKDIDVFVNSHYDLVRKRGRMFEVGIIEVGGAINIVFDPPMSPEEFKEWIRGKMKYLHEEFPYDVEDMVSGSVWGHVFATLETKVEIIRKGGFTVPRTEVPSGKLRDISPYFTISFKITAPEEILDKIKHDLSRARNEKEALRTLSLYLSVFKDSITATPISTDDEDEYDYLSFEIHEKTGGRASLGQPEGLVILLSRILDLLG